MTQAHALILTDEFVVQFLFWAGVVTVSALSAFWPWWKTGLGRTVILEIVCLTTALFPSVLGLELGVNVESVFWQWWVAVTFFVAGAVTLARIPVIFRIQRSSK